MATLKESVDAGRSQLKNLNRLDIEINEILSNVGKEENRQRLLMKDLMRLIDKNKKYFQFSEEPGSGLASIAGTSKSIGIQIDLKDNFSVVDDRTIPTMPQNIPPPLAPMVIVQRGSNVPYELRKVMGSFPQVLRVPPLAWVCQTMMEIYFAKISADKEQVSMGLPKETLSVFTHRHFRTLTGLGSYADVQTMQVLAVCAAQKDPLIPRVGLFISQIGLRDKESLPSIDVRDTDFILEILESLLQHGELMEAKAAAKRTGKAFGKLQATTTYSAVGIKPDILRSTAVHAMGNIFKKWALPDGGEEYLVKIKSMPFSEKSNRHVDVDDMVALMMEPWQTIRANWEEHARYLFQVNCIIYRVIQEALFATDDGQLAQDAIVAEIKKNAAADCIRRPLRNFMLDKDKAPDAGGNTNKEPVVEVMDRATFIKVLKIPPTLLSSSTPLLLYSSTPPFLSTPLHSLTTNPFSFHYTKVLGIINPTLKYREIEVIFEEALDIAHVHVLQVLIILSTVFYCIYYLFSH